LCFGGLRNRQRDRETAGCDIAWLKRDRGYGLQRRLRGCLPLLKLALAGSRDGVSP